MTLLNKVCLCTLLGLDFASAADLRWIRMRSQNFEVYSTAGEKSTRETLTYFEQVRGFFAQSMLDKSDNVVPVRIVVFGSMKEYEPYRINEFAVAYYKATAGRDYIVMSHAGSETFPTAVHEYVHLFLRHEKMDFPPWLNEGMAELYSTLKPVGDKIIVGDLILGRLQSLLQDRWVPLSTILAADHNSPYYNEKNKAGSLYNEGWALTHMLSLNPEYRPQFKQVMAAIMEGIGSEEALTKAYGKPLAAIEKDLRAYLRGDRFKGAVFAAKLENVSEQISAEPAPAFDVKLIQADLTDRPGNEAQIQKMLGDLTQEEPGRPEAYVALAYLALRQNHIEAAQRNFDKAFALGARDTGMLWDYARISEQNNAPAALQALSELLVKQPERVDARIELAAMQLRAGHAPAALQALAPVRKVTSAEAGRFFTLLAYAHFQNGDTEEARKAAQRVASLATTAEDRSRADQLLKYLDGEKLDRAKTAALTAAGPGDRAPLLTRRQAEETSSSGTEQAAKPSITGSFVQLDCEGAKARIVLLSGNRKTTFLIQDPTRIQVIGPTDKAGKMDLTCGPQKPATVRVEYEPAPSSIPNVDGLVRVIQFDPPEAAR